MKNHRNAFHAALANFLSKPSAPSLAELRHIFDGPNWLGPDAGDFWWSGQPAHLSAYQFALVSYLWKQRVGAGDRRSAPSIDVEEAVYGRECNSPNALKMLVRDTNGKFRKAQIPLYLSIRAERVILMPRH